MSPNCDLASRTSRPWNWCEHPSRKLKPARQSPVSGLAMAQLLQLSLSLCSVRRLGTSKSSSAVNAALQSSRSTSEQKAMIALCSVFACRWGFH